MAHSCNPSTLGWWGRWITRSRDRDHPGQHGETPSLLKIQKISWAWWCMPVIPATQEAEAGELPEPRRRRLRSAEIAPLHSSLGNKSETLSQKKTKKHSYWPDMVVHPYNPSYLGGWGKRIAWTQEVEVAVSQDCAITLQAGQQSDQNKQTKKTTDLIWASNTKQIML